MAQKICMTAGTMVLTALMAIVVSMVHDNGDPLKIFNPSASALIIAVPMWVLVSFLTGQVLLHSFTCSCRKKE